ncbi:FGGY family carbohydrate kinase [Nocardioides sp. Soil805]|uniref:FGGY family carbohydrate kinase n=1 Tax=Nocardioides sp. Soil805 TaxID=1736416 RepID=UPI0009E7845F|nr:FGGY family carbohydrate kinase [Nocardioides sp. Soil805]
MSLLAIHAATTEVTAVVVDPRGRIVSTAGHELVRHAPRPGWVEHAPEDIWQATLRATREVLASTDATDVTALGVTNQRGTVVLWDRETLGSPRPAIGSQDRRTTEIVARMRAEGVQERVAGLRLGPSFASTLTWLAEHEPHTWALVESGRYAVGTLDSYLVARMTRGTWHASDVSNASSTGLLDLRTGGWSDELCGVFGVPRDALPDLVPSWGEVAASEPRVFLGLELPIAGVAGDRSAALVARGCLEPGDALCALGPDPSILLSTGPVLEQPVAGLLPTVAWRSPVGEPTYALEGPLGGRDVLEAVPSVRRLRVDGAGAGDDVACQAMADRTGLPVERGQAGGTPALGVALLAGLGDGVWDSLDGVRDVWALDRRFEPVSG